MEGKSDFGERVAMRDYVILTDSSCDLPAALAAELGIEVLPLRVNLNGREFRNFLDERELDHREFYNALRSGGAASTSAVNPEEFLEVLTPFLEAGRDVLYLAFASALSSTCQNGAIAAKELEERFPGRRVLVVDTKCASMGQGLLVYLTGLKAKEGASLTEARDYAEATAPRIAHWFTVDDLFFLKRGGRVSAATAAVGTLLNIKPVLHVDDEGRLISMSKARGRKAAVKAIYDKCAQTADHPEAQHIFISHGDCPEDAQTLRELIETNLHPLDVTVSPIGPVIGAHSGPATLAVFFLADVR